MKKALLIIASVVALLAIVIVGCGIYITGTPEFALKKISDDLKDSGIEGLYPHLTDEARGKLKAVTENQLLGSIIGLIGQNDYVQELQSKAQEIQWDVKDILKGKEKAAVTLSFNYKDKLVGTLELSMIQENGEWKIDGLEFPEFDKID